uniref:Ig-like domain-containing protein n=1 Tax=Pyxicephalus adspersus TaxID=30357 RepID=A0AAV2ZV56_PYXAD|nr:TPA: hypothetical protein GDO54_003356 [Pyxicephalus adspersus]
MNGQPLPQDPRYYITQNEPLPYSTLIISPVSRKDNGNFTCTVPNKLNNETSNAVTLSLASSLSAPVLILNPDHDHLVSGSNVTLHCNAGNQHIETYIFYRDGKNICSQPHVTCRDSYLYFQPITESDSGSYTCAIQNPVSISTSNTLQVTISAPGSGTELNSNTLEWVWEGESVSLYCSTQVVDVTILWKVDGNLLPPSDRYDIFNNEAKTNSTLTISPIFINDTGSYTCEVTNTMVKEISNAVNLNVAKPPDSLSIDCTAKAYIGGILLTCSWTGGQPAADIKLSFNGTINKGQNMVNRSINLDNDVQQAEFICHGNQLGKISKCNITLERPLSKSHDNNAVTSVTEGENIKLTVSLTSQNPLFPEYNWFHLSPDTVNITSDGKYTVESSSSQSTLIISNVTGNESGNYECKVRNTIGSTSFKFNLEVKSKGSGGLSGGAIAGIVIGVLAGVALIGVGVFFLVKKLK